MMVEYDPLETFARLYFERNGYFVRTNVYYGKDEVDIVAIPPDKSDVIACYCTTSTTKQKIEGFSREYLNKIKKKITEELEIENVKFWFFTLWLGEGDGAISRCEPKLKERGFDEIIGPSEVISFVDDIVQEYNELWERKGREGPREFEPILWTIKMLWRIEYFKRNDLHG
ncbi:MAG: hypothetical protein IB616_01270 [Methanosarcinales archaeon]|nr:MAG: hypothetical protein IB616_01270 [Methanosarcinales archaeon]